MADVKTESDFTMTVKAYHDILMDSLGRVWTMDEDRWLPHEPVDVDARVYVELGERTFYSSYSDDPSPLLSDFIAELNEIAAKAPKRCNVEVVIEMTTESDYDGPSHPRYEIGYWRDPTKKERAEREETNRKVAERAAREAEEAAAKEREEFERLKAKYEA